MTLEDTLVSSYFRRRYFRAVELPAILAIGVKPGLDVLEIGCGAGHLSAILRRALATRTYVAVDPGVRPRRHGGVLFRRGYAEDLPAAGGSVDVVIELCCFHHVQPWRAAVAEVKRVLRRPGMVIFEDFPSDVLRRWYYRWFDHPAADRFSEAEFLAELGGGTILRRTFFGQAFLGYQLV